MIRGLGYSLEDPNGSSGGAVMLDPVQHPADEPPRR